MKLRNLHPYSALVGVAAAAAAACAPAVAADAAGTSTAEQGSPALEEVVITAERREASAQKSAISVSVLTGAELASGGIVNTVTLLDRVPGLDMTHANITSNLSLRGLGSGGSTQYSDPVIAFNIGGVPLSRQFATSGAFYDLERVEVLKGPQGTLYGRNATVGALNVIPNRPSHELGGTVGVDLGNYSSVHVDGAFNLPVSNKVAVRFAGSSNKRDGYLSNGYDDLDNRAGRVSLAYDPTEDVSLLARLDYYKDSSKGPSAVFRYINPGQEWQVPDNPWFAFGPAGCGNTALCPTWADSAGAPFDPSLRGNSVVNNNGYVNLKQLIYSVELNWALPFAKLTVLPSHVETDLDSLSYGTGLTFWPKANAKQNAIEARLGSEGNEKLRWVAGLFYFREHIDAFQRTLEPAGFQLGRTPNLIDESRAAFGEITYSLTDRLRLTGGLRYTSEKKSQDGFTLLDGAFNATTCPSPGFFVTGATTAYGFSYPVGYCQVPNSGNLDFNDTSWKAAVEYDVANESLLYANVRTGFKAGGLAPALPPNTYKPEKLTAYEIGSKNRFWNDRLQANVELFYWDYKDQQISVLHPLTPAGQTAWPVNVDGWVSGAELNLTAAVTRTTRLELSLLHEDGKYDVYPTVVTTGGTIGGLTDFRRINMPKWSGTLTAEQQFVLPSGAALVLGADAHSESEVLLRPIAPANQRPGDFRDAFITADIDFGYRSADGKWSITAYCNNVSDEAVVGTGSSGGISAGVFYRPPTNAADARYATLQPPRTYGIRLNATF